jgi:glycosyltransferase involved in cell wall biosynthesis
MNPKSPGVSIIIPVHNEEDNIQPLQQAINSAFKDVEYNYEVIWVNDGSTDGTSLELSAVKDSEVKVYSNDTCRGQSKSIYEGYLKTRYDLVATIDGDGQNDPSDLPKMIEILRNDLSIDFVQGKRAARKDHFFSRIFLSRVANLVTRLLMRIEITDLGCGTKVFRDKVMENIPIRGEMHRLYAAHAFVHKFKVVEIDVNHLPRLHGKSKYGVSRVFKFFFDLFFVKFQYQIQNRPIYLFGKIATFLFLVGTILFFTSLGLRVFGFKNYLDSTLIIGAILVYALSMISIFLGLLADLLIRLSMRSNI